MNTNPNAKRILIYGDSFTFGKKPLGSRYPINERYTGVLQNALGSDYEVIEEGLRGRMLSGENAFFPHRNGLSQFDGILGSHLPLDLLVFFLGTNDTNSGNKLDMETAVNTYVQYLKQIDWWCEHLGFSKPKILLVAPPAVGGIEILRKVFGDIFVDAAPRAAQLPALIGAFAKKHNLYFFDSSKIISPDPLEGVHLSAESNRILGEALAETIKEIL